jgi:hypothetical protein
MYQLGSSVDAIATLGVGPGVDLAAILADKGGCLYLEATDGVAGAAGAVTPVRVGTSTGTITVAGTATNEHQVAIEITATGTLGAARFRYRLEYNALLKAQSVLGSGWSPEIVVPTGATYVLGATGITLTFVPGAGAVFFQDGDVHTFATTAPHYTAANFTTAMGALPAQLGNLYFDQVFCTGVNNSGADAATMAAAVETEMDDLEDLFYFGRALMDAGSPDTASNVKTGLVAFSSNRVGVVYGYAYTASKVPQLGRSTPKLPLLVNFAERAADAAQVDISQNLGRVLSGGLRGVSYITHDEGDGTPAFIEEDKINTARTFIGASGIYATNGYLKSGMGSDYLYWDWGCTMDKIARVQYLAQFPWVLAKLESKVDGSGQVTEGSALRVESAIQGQLKTAIRDPKNVEGGNGYVSGLSYTISRTNNFLSTRQLVTTTQAVPLVPIEGFVSTLGFARSV